MSKYTIPLRAIPKIRDSLSYLYLEHARLEQDQKSITIFREDGRLAVPCASLATLLLGPGTSITHAAIRTLGENGCTVHWVGEECLRFYASGRSLSGNTERLQHQARCWADPERHLAIVRAMYEVRFQEVLPPDLTLEQVRGLEGVRVRSAYQQASRATGVPWKNRDFDRDDGINQALSIANACLYGVCHAAIAAVGYSPALGFVHTGKPLAFVYDIADLYKVETTLPVAFEAVAAKPADLNSEVRRRCRETFRTSRILNRLVPDLDRLLGFRGADSQAESRIYLWDDLQHLVPGRRNWSSGQP